MKLLHLIHCVELILKKLEIIILSSWDVDYLSAIVLEQLIEFIGDVNIAKRHKFLE